MTSPIIIPDGFVPTASVKHRHCWHSYDAPANAGLPVVQFCCAGLRAGECFDVRLVDADAAESVDEKNHGILSPTGTYPRIVERVKRRVKQETSGAPDG